MSKVYEYGPVNCNVARVRNAEQRPDTCERCGYSNEQGCSSASLAEHCLFYSHQPGFGFKLKPEYERNKPPHRGALASDPVPKPLVPVPPGIYYGETYNNFYHAANQRGMGIEFWNKWKDRKDEFPQSHEAALVQLVSEGFGYDQSRPTRTIVGTKTTRIQRAKIMDRIEAELVSAAAHKMNYSIEKETEELTKDILDILNAS
jgi:hypothetical protein